MMDGKKFTHFSLLYMVVLDRNVFCARSWQWDSNMVSSSYNFLWSCRGDTFGIWCLKSEHVAHKH